MSPARPTPCPPCKTPIKRHLLSEGITEILRKQPQRILTGAVIQPCQVPLCWHQLKEQLWTCSPADTELRAS